MMKRYLFIGLLLLPINMSLLAYNSFIYLRFDQSTNNIDKLKQEIQNIINASDNVILYYNHSFVKGDELVNLLEDKGFLMNISVYEPYQETQELTEELTKLLGDWVESSYGLSIKGEQDSIWKLYFILSEESNRTELIKWYDVNGLNSRDIYAQFITYDNATIMNRQTFSDFVSDIDNPLLLKF